ncbi:MAG: NADH:flavin oxidoreductase [Deltaproteobacteria bacterium]|nr:NADH:flavin oxidoreductase [Deltaproteobacteria bacterium]MBW2596138.1 NADH:flavin oxidoreductase [Deltaproteobacteria bacterium]
MSKLFENSVINGMNLPNRFVRSATWEGMAADDGAVTPKLIETMAALARGGVGLIISSHAYIRPEGQGSPWQLGIYNDELVPGLQEMTAEVHACGGRIIAQLAHAGCFTSTQLTGQPPLAVSDFDELTTESPRKEITARDIRGIVDAFAAAARRAKSAGFDGVQIHSAHGYLLSQFLSPAFNKRRDEYGGSIHNRARIHLEVCRAVREAVGEDYPVLIKMNCRDCVEDGLDLEESLQVARLLAGAGLDAIELSGGTLASGRLSPSRSKINSQDREAYFREEASAFKKKIGIPLILVGGMRSIEVAKQLVENGVADYISMSRPFIREPDLINRWKAGDLRKAQCKSDNLCFGPGLEGKGIYCVVKKDEEVA